MISNFHAIIFEYHQLLFQFWKGICLSSRNISDNLIRDGFRPQFYYHYRGDISFHLESKKVKKRSSVNAKSPLEKADKSPDGCMVVDEYVSNDLASGSDKRLRRARSNSSVSFPPLIYSLLSPFLSSRHDWCSPFFRLGGIALCLSRLCSSTFHFSFWVGVPCREVEQ